MVLKTMTLSQKVANECHQNVPVVTYDLAIAKMAKAIQVAESPRFDDLFISFGVLHIKMAYFKAMGYIIGYSGGPEVLVNADVLGKGSLNGFVTVKHFNWCK